MAEANSTMDPERIKNIESDQYHGIPTRANLYIPYAIGIAIPKIIRINPAFHKFKLSLQFNGLSVG